MSDWKKLVVVTGALFCLVALTGCSKGDTDMVDKPLTTTNTPPPPRPDKPTLTPGGGGSTTAPGAGTTSTQ